MSDSPLKNPLAIDLSDEAIGWAKKKYKKRRSGASLDRGMGDVNNEGLSEVVPLNGSSGNVPLQGVSYKDRVTGNFEEDDSTWEEWVEEEGGDDSIMFDEAVWDVEDGEGFDSSLSSSSAPAPSPNETLNTGFVPWMIVQRRSRRPVREIEEKGKSKTTLGKEHDSRNRFQSLQGLKSDSREKLKEVMRETSKAPNAEDASKSSTGVNGFGRKIWKPKKDLGNKSSHKVTGKEEIKGKMKNPVSQFKAGVDVPQLYSVFEDGKIIGPPPGFSFKAGSSKPVNFDPERLEELVGSNSFGLLNSLIKPDGGVVDVR
ncbi:hypothetical protein COLO4_05448 [Corchorus olitorius]|uniref:Uncharacterized protein n=1 Tax=Corchorus olitorius TaxID=93759 RepID=A0A1R3KQT2_9ROSI|nr:hypothetical protein COLO4_05448 [Corchorus olitorius]